MIPISACGKRPPESFGCSNQTHDYTKQLADVPRMLTWGGGRPRPSGRVRRPSLHKHVTIFRMKLLRALITTLILNLCVQAQSAAKAVTVPITLDHNRTIIDVYLTLPDGKNKRVRAWVDNGNPELTITQALAQKLGLQLSQ